MVFVKRETRFLLWSAIVFLAIGLRLTAIRVRSQRPVAQTLGFLLYVIFNSARFSSLLTQKEK
jgi:hypothetical protein